MMAEITLSSLILATVGEVAPAGSVAGKLDVNVRTTGDITLNSTSFTDLDPSGSASARDLDVVLTAEAGEWVLLYFEGRFNSAAVDGRIDAATIVSGAVVNNLYGNAGSVVWRAPSSEDAMVGGWGKPYQVQAGDLDGGQVRFRFRYATNTATNRTLFAGGNNPLTVAGRVLG